MNSRLNSKNPPFDHNMKNSNDQNSQHKKPNSKATVQPNAKASARVRRQTRQRQANKENAYQATAGKRPPNSCKNSVDMGTRVAANEKLK